MQRTRKAEVIETLETEFKGASSMIVADYRGLSVSQLARSATTCAASTPRSR